MGMRKISIDISVQMVKAPLQNLQNVVSLFMLLLGYSTMQKTATDLSL